MTSSLAWPLPAAVPMRHLLRLEAAAELAVLGLVYARLGGDWWRFMACFLLPDLAMAGYLAGPRLGALCYNAAHLVIGPAVLAALALAGDWPAGVTLALIWAAHIAFDRALGYGLKYASGFGDTHLGRGEV